MGRIVANGRTYPPSLTSKPAGQRAWTNRKFQFDVYGPNLIRETEDNLAAVAEHFGCNKSVAHRIALRLLATAIRKGRMSL
jgi:hypothetical protein